MSVNRMMAPQSLLNLGAQLKIRLIHGEEYSCLIDRLKCKAATTRDASKRIFSDDDRKMSFLD